MELGDFVNHIVQQLKRYICGPWQIIDLIPRQYPGSHVCYVRLLNINTNYRITLDPDSEAWVASAQKDGEDYYVYNDWMEGIMRGYVRDERGVMIPPAGPISDTASPSEEGSLPSYGG